jgi:chemotaxis signal transduction protein
MLPQRASRPPAARTRNVTVFALGKRCFALPAGQVVEITRVPSFTPLPCEDPAHLGVVVHRETVIPLVDLGLQLGVCRPCSAHAPGLCLFFRTTLGEIACPIDQVLGLAPASDARLSQPITLPDGVAIFRADAWEEHHGQVTLDEVRRGEEASQTSVNQ